MVSFFERFFHKSVPSEITYEDFLEFRKLNIEEHQNLDYKSGELLIGYKGQLIGKNGRLTSDEGFIALAKEVAGFANAEGGMIVLGIREIQEKLNGKIVKVRPGAIHSLPLGTVTKEMIESKLRSLIQFPIDDLTIVPLRSSNRSKSYVYILDIPQSIRIPHRVNEVHYYQRYNFETRPMLHYQINDLFGKRFAPVLDLEVEIVSILDYDITLKTTIYNFGRAIAKYPMCLWEITDGPYYIDKVQFGMQSAGAFAQYTPGSDTVIYPSVHLRAPDIVIKVTSSPVMGKPMTLECIVGAELTPVKQCNFRIFPVEQRIELISKSLKQ